LLTGFAVAFDGLETLAFIESKVYRLRAVLENTAADVNSYV